MPWLERILVAINPHLLISGTPWERVWREKSKIEFIRGARIFLALVMLIYLAHYYFFDVPMGLQPTERWFRFRFGMAAICLVGLVYYFSPLQESRLYKLPLILATLVFCYMQGLVVYWYPESNYLYCFALSSISAILIRTSVAGTIGYLLLATSFQTPYMLEAGIEAAFIVSATAVSCLLSAMVRSSYVSEIKYFLLNQENIATQKRLIELNIEFADRMRAFVPRVIYGRLEDEMDGGKISALQAVDSVLTPRKANIACLFSDIRGFTEGSKNLDEYINKGVWPNVKACTEAIEANQGIPRKVGDLIFSYFDDQNESINLIRCLKAGLEVARLNLDMNETRHEVDINRYILISTGEAIVGNLGGFNSSIEITALGSPVNFLSRLDEATKDEQLQSQIKSSDIIICENSKSCLDQLGLELDLSPIDLDMDSLSIRDFPDVRRIYSMQPTDQNYNLVSRSHSYIQEHLELDGGNAKIRA